MSNYSDWYDLAGDIIEQRPLGVCHPQPSRAKRGEGGVYLLKPRSCPGPRPHPPHSTILTIAQCPSCHHHRACLNNFLTCCCALWDIGSRPPLSVPVEAPQWLRLIDLFLANFNRIIPRDDLINEQYSTREEPEWAYSANSVVISRINARIEPLGLQIKSWKRQGMELCYRGPG